MSNPLGYATDYGVLDFHVSGDYQTLNGIRRSGPAPNALYGPSSSWINMFAPTASKASGSSSTVTISVGSGTVGANSDLPGLNSFYYAPSASYLYSQAGINALPLQIVVADTTAETITGISFYLSITDPSYCKFNPNASAAALQVTTSSGTFNSATTGISAVSPPVGTTSNADINSTTTGAISTSFSALTEGMTLTVAKLTTAQIATLAAASSSTGTLIVVPQLSPRSNVFLVTITFTGTAPGYASDTSVPFILNLPISAFYNVPTYPIY